LECVAAVCAHIPRNGRDSRNARLHARARAHCPRLANFADAIDLPANAQLLHLESDPARDQRRLGELGQTRAHRQRARASMKFAFAVAFLFSLGGSTVCGDSCGSFRDARGRSWVDLAPLPGFIDVCSRDFQLCVMLTEGYPPSVQTIGYFVPVEEWERYQKGQHKGFSRYLIAQKGETLSAESFADFKRYVHSQQGNI